MSTPAPSLTALGDLIRGLGSTVGQLVSCYIRAGSGTPTSWTHFLLPFGTPATPLPVGVWFTDPGTNVSVSTAHATAKATIDPSGLPSQTVRVIVELDLAAMPSLADPRLQLVICTERGVLDDGGPDPARLGVAVVDVRAAATSGTPSSMRLAVTLPPGDGNVTRASVEASVTPRPGAATAPLHVGLLDGAVTQQPALLATTVGLASLPAGLGDTLGDLLGGVLGGLLGGAGLTVTTSMGQIHTVEPDGPVTGLWARLDPAVAAAGGAVAWSADIVTSAAPGARPAVTTDDPGGALRLRYSVAARRSDGTETPPGADSAALTVAPGGAVQVALPPAPSGFPGFAGWRVYRARLDGAEWSTPVPVGDHGASASFTDTVPADDPTGTVPPEPAAVTLVWHGPATASVQPLAVEIETLDEVLDALAPPARPTVRLTGDLVLPASVRLELAPARGADRAMDVHWESGPAGPRASADVRFERPRGGVDAVVACPALPRTIDLALLVDTPRLTTLTWQASETCAATASARVDGRGGGSLELTDVAVSLPERISVGLRVADEPVGGPPLVVDVAAGWRASAPCGPIVARVVETPAPSSGDPATLTDVRVETLPVSLAAHLRLGAEGAADPPLLVDAGGWSGAPAPGDVPSGTPGVGGPGDPVEGLRLVRRPRPTTLPALPGRGRGPALAADLRSTPAGLALLDVRASGVGAILIDKAAGVDTDVRVTGAIAPTSVRLQLASVDDDGVPSTIQVRARRLGPSLDLRIENRGERYLDVTLGPEIDPIEGLRIFQESGGTTGGARHPVASHRPTAASEVSSVVAALDEVPRGSSHISLHPVGDEPPAGSEEPRPVRVGARLGESDDGPLRRLRLSLRASTDGDGDRPVDVDVALPSEVHAVLQGDAGTLGPDTGAGTGADVTLHDPLGVFEAGWRGRRVRWAGGAGTVADVTDATHLTVTPDGGSTTPDENAGRPAADWYWVVDDPSRDAGVRVLASRPVRVRVAAAAIGGWGLCGVTATPQVRVETMPDLVMPETLDEPSRGATAGLAVRIAGLVRAAQSSWRGEGEMARLLGTTSDPATLRLPPQADVLAESPEAEPVPLPDPLPAPPARLAPPLSWLCVAVQLEDRPIRSLAAVIHQPSDRPDATALAGQPRTQGAQPRLDLGRDALRLRLFDVPDGVRIRTGPGAMEFANSDAIRGGRMHAEPALWFRSPAPFAEAGYGSTVINEFPPNLVLASGVAAPDLGGGVTTTGSLTFGTLTARSWNTPATRIVVSGGGLDLGRQRSVAWDGPRSGSRDPWARDTATDGSLGSEVFWSLSDVWFMRLAPTGSGPGELVLFTPGEPKGDGDPKSAIQVRATDVAVTARILKVKLGSREMVPARRAALEAGGWPTEIAAEIQLDAVEGAFAVGMDDLTILDWMQTDQTTAGHWWMAAYGAIPVGSSAAQFGSSAGTIDLRDAPWDPYWA